MKIFRDLKTLPPFNNAVLTMGSFDGVHMGHQEILRRIIKLAKRVDGESVVLTFDPHPRQVIYPKDNSLRLLSSTREKLDHLEALGIDNAVVLPFTIEFSQQSAREYVETFLIDKFNPKCLVVGYDHRFGLNREGDYNLLKRYADEGAFELVQIPKQDIENVTVSSTRIRNALSDGNVDQANQLLGYPYAIRGKVVHGEKIGKQIGYPTANIRPEEPLKLLPADGIYAVNARIGEDVHPAMLYIGSRPTVNGGKAGKRIEAHILDFSDNIYDHEIEVKLVSFIRSDQKLENLEALRRAIRQDEINVRSALSAVKPAAAHVKTAVVALNYNGMKVMPQYLPSFRRHKGKAEIVVADNGSNDGSAEWIAEHYPEFRLITLKQNTGYAGGYNNALKEVDAKYFALVNTDVELTADWLTPLIDTLEQHPNIGAVQPKILAALNHNMFEYAGAAGGYIDTLGFPFCAGRILQEVEMDSGQYDSRRAIFWASGAAFVIRRELFEDLGGFDADFFAHMEEIDLCWRIQRAGYRIEYVPDSVVYHQGGATLPYESTRKVFLNFRNNLATIIKNSRATRLLYVLPCRVVLDTLAAIHFLVGGRPASMIAVFRAYLALILWIPSLIRKRRENDRLIKRASIGNEVTDGRYKGSIIWQFYARGHKTFAALYPRGDHG